MNANDLLRIVDSLHREKSIDKELVFRAIESALVTAAKKHYGEEAEVDFVIDREKGGIIGGVDGQPLDYEEVIGRIGAQTAKQVIIQKVREAERDVLVEEYASMQDDLISGMVRQHEGGATIVNLGRLDAILPRSEQIPGESHHANERVRAMITEVRTQGNRVKVVLSRTRPLLVQRLFEQEIPEIADGVINIDSISREPGYRSKVAVSSIDQRVDCVGACVGVGWDFPTERECLPGPPLIIRTVDQGVNFLGLINVLAFFSSWLRFSLSSHALLPQLFVHTREGRGCD